MKFSIWFIIFGSLFMNTPFLHAETLISCENGGSASLGDIKHQVRLSCGEPDGKEIIGYIDKIQNEERIRVMKIEEWIYSSSFYGEKYYYSLIFEGNKLTEIKKFNKK